MSNLVEHAKRELAIIGEDEDTINGYLSVIRAFSRMGHSGGSAAVAIPTINLLLRFRNLAPLTDDVDEWQYIRPSVWGDLESHGAWQNKRNSAAFSLDAGQSYYLVTEKRSRWLRRRKFHKTEHKKI